MMFISQQRKIKHMIKIDAEQKLINYLKKLILKEYRF